MGGDNVAFAALIVVFIALLLVALFLFGQALVVPPGEQGRAPSTQLVSSQLPSERYRLGT